MLAACKKPCGGSYCGHRYYRQVSCASLTRIGCDCAGCCTEQNSGISNPQQDEDAVASDLLAEARRRHNNSEDSAFGRLFVHTGAWWMSEGEWGRTTSNCSLPHKELCAYKLDEGLAGCLAHFFHNLTNASSVTELGAGVGRYSRYIESATLNHTRVAAYDGMPDISNRTHGRVQHADLSVVRCSPTSNASGSRRRIATSDWALTLEVAEHVAPQYEAR